MPHRAGEVCEACRKHIHPQTKPGAKLHPPPACDRCLPRGHVLQLCAGCKHTLYCGKACQKSHRRAHKEDCNSSVWIKHWAQAYGPEMAQKQASFARWCEDNNQAFAMAAREAWGSSPSLSKETAYDYVFFVVVQTDVQETASIASSKQTSKFAHSIVMAHRQSRKEMHNKLDEPMGIFYHNSGGPGAVEKFILPTPGFLRVVLQNVNLMPPVNLYTLSFEDPVGMKFEPDWLKHLKKAVE